MNGKQAKRARVDTLLTKTPTDTPGPADLSTVQATVNTLAAATGVSTAAMNDPERTRLVNRVAQAAGMSTVEVERAIDRLNNAWGAYWAAMDRHIADLHATRQGAERRAGQQP